MTLPSWKLPLGVCRGTWDYLQSKSIAQDYDRCLADSPLLKLDQQFIVPYLPKISDDNVPRIADFGCGTGRISRMLSPMGYRMLNIDLSSAMLEVLRENCQHPELNEFAEANLVELDFLQPESLDMGLCLFSSIGMIRGRKYRQKFLSSVALALRPSAPLIVHVHNRYHSLWHPSGPTWLAMIRLKSWFGKNWEYGDRVFVDLGLPSMFLHIYSRKELLQDLRTAGFTQVQVFPISVLGDRLMAESPTTAFRAGGFFAVATK